jgi:hypothetical protein
VTTRFEDVPLHPGTSNTIVIREAGGGANFSLDDLVITHAGDRARAEPHRRALGLSAGDFANLLAYLRQIDGSPESNLGLPRFVDDFETGDIRRWARTVP